ncbi:MAG: hypothetical protein KY053_00710 [Candidatus Liptonbacteria bacterium]|nr:hypothetical protein [Candidatus Liptonbacteria bacterium]
MNEELKQGNQDKKAIALLSYIGILFLIPFFVEKSNPFIKFHIKQGITLFIANLIAGAILIIPIIGWIVGLVAFFTFFVFAIIGIINVLTEKTKPLPLIGKYADFWKI